MAKLQLWVAFGKRRGNDPLHWILMVASEDGSDCTWYHVTGGPTLNTAYKLVIQNKRFKSFGVTEHHYVADIDAKDLNKVKASAQSAPMQRCQRWSVEVLADLERKKLVPAGTAQYWSSRIETSPYEATAGPSASESPWVWDKTKKAYRYWDEKAKKWVWEQEVRR